MTSSPIWLDQPHRDRLAAAKLWVISPDSQAGIRGLPYLSAALFALVPVPSDRVAAMQVDQYWRLYVNPIWLETHDVGDIGREMAHLVWHLLAEHAGRAADMLVTSITAAHWRAAADAAVAQVLPFPAPGIQLHEQLRSHPDLSAEEYFAILGRLEVDAPEPRGVAPADDPIETDPPASCGSGCDGLARAHELRPSAQDVPAVTRHAADSIRRQVAVECREHHRGWGDLPGQWARWAQQILAPEVPWQQVLNAAVRRGIGWATGQTDYTYTRVSRRQAASGRVVLPALRRPMPAVAIVVDTSGSMDDGLLAQALGEVDGVLATMAVPDSSVTVLSVDAAVHTVESVRSARALRLGGGGGTDMTVGIDAALATRPAPQVVIVITDGLTAWPSIPPQTPVVAVLLGRQRHDLPATPDWLQRVEVVSDS